MSFATFVGSLGGQEEGGGGEAEDRRPQEGQGASHGLLLRRIHAMLQVKTLFKHSDWLKSLCSQSECL